MNIIGCDLHTRFQQIAMLDANTGELIERRLEHENGEARSFYEGLSGPVRVGMEATGYARWFERMLRELGHELWIGDAAQIRRMVVRKQKTDRRDALHLLDLLMSDRFPRIYLATLRERDQWQLLRHRCKLVRWRTSIRNQLHGLAMAEGVCRKRKLWSRVGRAELEALVLDEWASRRRKELLELLDGLEPAIEQLDQAVEQTARQRPEAALLQKQSGVGPVTSLAFALMVGPVERFRNSRSLVSYVGLNPREASSGGQQRLGSISKQGNVMVRWLLLQAAQTAARRDPELQRDYRRVMSKKGRPVAKVMVARKLAVRLYWMLREQSQNSAAGSHAG